MPNLYPPAGPQSIGQVLDSAFRIFRVSLVRCLLFGALAMIAGQLPNLYLIARGKPLRSFGSGDPVWFVLYFAGVILTLWMFSVLLLRQRNIAVGSPQSTSVEVSVVARRLPAILGVTLLTACILGIGPGILAGIYFAMDPGPAAYGVVALGVIILLVPITYLMTPLTFVTPSVILDGKGALATIGYSLRLIRGNWWRTSTIFTVALIVIFIFYSVATVIVGLVLSLVGAAGIAAVSAAAMAVLYVILGAMGMPFFSAVIVATFGELKVRKEGIDLEQRVAGIA